MASFDDAFEVWLGVQLAKFNLDIEVYVPYIMSILQSGDDISEIILNSVESTNYTYSSDSLLAWCSSTRKIFNDKVLNSVLIVDESSTIDCNKTVVTPADVLNSSSPNEYSVQSDMCEESLQTAQCNNDTTHPENVLEHAIDIDLLEEFVVYLLRFKYPNQIFSREAIITAVMHSMSADNAFTPTQYSEVLEQWKLFRNMNASGDATSLCRISIVPSILYHNVKYVQQCKPCRHYANGGQCYRSDCPFDHTLEQIPCIYWLTSECSKVSCRFLHSVLFDIDATSQVEGDELTPAQLAPATFELHNEELFPELPSVANQNSTVVPGKKSASASLKEVMSSKFVYTSSSSSNVRYSDSSAGQRVASSTKASKRHSTEYFDYNEWVNSGGSVAAEYASMRDEARTLACSRNVCLQEATRAYLSGDRQTAKALAKRGQQLNAEMKSCHKKAAMSIFNKKNVNSNETSVFDLHGLHISEALEIVSVVVDQYKHTGGTVLFVTGSGHHSSGPQNKARLYPSVLEYVHSVNIEYAQVKDKNGYVGGLKLFIHPI